MSRSNIDKIVPGDKRVKWDEFAEVNGHRWHYLDAPATSPERGLCVLVHGFPDISLAWRYQIPLLTSLGFRCVSLDCMGYGLTGSSWDLRDFTFKRHAEVIEGIAKKLGYERLVLGGHDWGGAVVWRVGQWCPQLVSHVFSVATPYFSVQEKYISTEELVKGPLPQYGYQLQLGSEDRVVESYIQGSEGIKKWLNGMYGGKPKSGKAFFTPEHGVDIEVFKHDELSMTPLLDEEELDYYVREFSRHGVNGPCNWYRTRKLNWEEELSMPTENKKGLQQPVLFIQALRDSILRPEMSRNMERSLPHLTRGEVDASHWALWHTPKETNAIIKQWFEEVVLGGKSKL